MVLKVEAVAKGELTLLPSVPAIATVVRGGVVVGDLSLWFWRGRVSFHRGEKLIRQFVAKVTQSEEREGYRKGSTERRHGRRMSRDERREARSKAQLSRWLPGAQWIK